MPEPKHKFLDILCVAGCGRRLHIDLGPRGRTPKEKEKFCQEDDCIQQREINLAFARVAANEEYNASSAPSEQTERFGKPKEDVETSKGLVTLTAKNSEDRIADSEQGGVTKVAAPEAERRQPSYLKSVAQVVIVTPTTGLPITNNEGDLVHTIPLEHSITSPPHRGPRSKRTERAKPIPCPHGKKRDCSICKFGKYAVPELFYRKPQEATAEEITLQAVGPPPLSEFYALGIPPMLLPENCDSLKPEDQKQIMRAQKAEVERRVKESSRWPHDIRSNAILPARVVLGLRESRILSWLENPVIRAGGTPTVEERLKNADSFEWIKTPKPLSDSGQTQPSGQPEVYFYEGQIYELKKERRGISQTNPDYALFPLPKLRKLRKQITQEINLVKKLQREQEQRQKAKKVRVIPSAPVPSVVLQTLQEPIGNDQMIAAGYEQVVVAKPKEKILVVKTMSPKMYITDGDIKNYVSRRLDLGPWSRTLFENEVIRRVIHTGISRPTPEREAGYLDLHVELQEEFPSVFDGGAIDYAGRSKRPRHLWEMYVEDERDPEEDGKENAAMIHKTQGGAIGGSIYGQGYSVVGTGEDTRLRARALESFDNTGKREGIGGTPAGADSYSDWGGDLDSGNYGEEE
jgi:hypothetical protein